MVTPTGNSTLYIVTQKGDNIWLFYGGTKIMMTHTVDVYKMQRNNIYWQSLSAKLWCTLRQSAWTCSCQWTLMALLCHLHTLIYISRYMGTCWINLLNSPYHYSPNCRLQVGIKPFVKQIINSIGHHKTQSTLTSDSIRIESWK